MENADARFSDETMEQEKSVKNSGLGAYMTPAGAWAFALGTSIGWGSLVITSSTYLLQAGPAGSAAGMLIGALIMLVIVRNYHYLMNCFPEAGGAYAYARDAFGYDHGFLVAWFLTLTYISMLWANATALPLFARYFIGDMFEKGRMYSLFGYEVYAGEALLSIAAILAAALICMGSQRVTGALMIIMAVFITAGILVCFLIAVLRLDRSMAPAFVPDSHALPQVFRIAAISPWAFIGLESISHSTEEFTFRRSLVFRIFTVSVIVTTMLYILVTLLSASAYPERYSSWLEYIRDCGNLSGIEGLPAFYAARHYMGQSGVNILMLVLLMLIITSLIGNITALSRLFYALSKDMILPGYFSKVNRLGAPANAMKLIAALSLVIPFVGRTAIGWIVDVTTFGATLIYGFVSASALKMARTRQDKSETVTGTAGLLIMIFFALNLLLPSLFTSGSMETATYFLFVVWSVLGFIYFRTILNRDKTRRFGKSIIVWIALLALILFVSLVWMSQSNIDATSDAMSRMQEYYSAAGFTGDQTLVVAEQMRMIRATNARSIAAVFGLFILALGMLLNNYSLMSRRAQESEELLGKVRDLANTDPLTGVKSKHAFTEMERETDERIAADTVGHFAVVVCDVNGLKHVNDTLGHKAGDEYIRQASSLICELFQHSPVYRIGGDEFVVMITGRDWDRRLEIVQQLHDISAANIGSGKVVVSGGISDFDAGKDKAVNEVFQRADKRMYEEKKLLKSMGSTVR